MFKFKHSTFILFLLLGLFSLQAAIAQYNIPDRPSFIPPVIDSTQTLSSAEYKLLYDKLKNYSDSTSTEILTIIIPSTKGENIGLLAPRWGHKWKIGQKKEDNGLVILLAKDDRQIWIAPGYGVEDKLTAGIVGELTRNTIIPEFKKGDYYQGLNKGIDAIFEVLNGKYKSPRKSDNNGKFPVGLIFIIIFIIILISISKNRRGGNNGRGGKRRGGLDIWDVIILSNMGRGSFGSGSGGFGGSSGGFGGFGGGGGFSGGGAGGSW